MDSRLPTEPPKPISASEWIKAAPVSLLIVAINVAVFMVAERSGSTRDTATLLQFGAVWRGRVWAGEWWRLFTAMWLHIGIVHLVWNQWFGFRLCIAFERELGKAKFLALYLASGVAGAAVSVIGHDAVGAGASGALFGLIGARYLQWRLRLGSWSALWNDPAGRRDMMTTAVWFLLGVYAHFDNYAHLGGLLFGIVGAWALLRLPAKAPLAVAVVFLLALVGASLRPLPVLHERDRRLRSAYDSWTAKNWEKVLADTEPLAKEQPMNDWVLDARLNALLELTRATEALPLADLRAKKKDLRGYQLRSSAHSLLKHWELAVADLDRAQALAPDDAWTLRQRMDANLKLWNEEAIRADAKHLIELGTPYEAYFALVSIAYRAGDRTEALSQARRAVEADPDDFTVQLYEPAILTGLGDIDAGIAALDALKRPESLTAEQRKTVVQIAAAAGRREQVERECDPATPHAALHALCGWSMLGFGDTAAASALFEASLAKERTAGGAAGLGWLALRRGDRARAEELSKEAVTIDPNDAEAAMVRAEVLLAAGDEAGAREQWKVAVTHSPVNWPAVRLASDAVRALRP